MEQASQHDTQEYYELPSQNEEAPALPPFPDEKAMETYLNACISKETADYERLSAAVNSGVRAWLREQGIDPDNPSECAESDPALVKP
ncbi:MAG: hypothetical protein IJH70_11535 [Oscillospiraceae bacterium]|nr:hypothetical protein [Oscillospiraceae bacterium]